jgi:SH3-like domain-containing protein
MTAARPFRLVPAALLLPALAAIGADFGLLRPAAEARMEHRVVLDGATIDLRVAPDRHAERIAALPGGARFHPTRTSRGAWRRVFVEPDMRGWISREDLHGRSAPCPRP